MSKIKFDLSAGCAKWFDAEGRNVMTDAAKMHAPVGVTGQFRDKMYAIRKTGMGGIVMEVHSGAEAPKPAWILKGTKPHFPPVAAITPWANSKGIPPWALAISISRKGTKANPFTRAAIASIRATVRQSLQASLHGYLTGK